MAKRTVEVSGRSKERPAREGRYMSQPRKDLVGEPKLLAAGRPGAAATWARTPAAARANCATALGRL
eukprot:3516994-Pyramimonas_sp.AAC.1